MTNTKQVGVRESRRKERAGEAVEAPARKFPAATVAALAAIMLVVWFIFVSALQLVEVRVCRTASNEAFSALHCGEVVQ